VSLHEFLARKAQCGSSGFEPLWMPDFLFDFQRLLVEWAVRKGKAAIFADCGLGKTPMQLVWAENVARKSGRPVLIATPLAVSHQVVAEGAKFGIEVTRVSDGTVPEGARIVVANYERLHHFNAQDFAGMVCDESSILKNFDGVRRAAVQEFMRTLPYRLLCTATAAPNDYTELGTSSEALGGLGHMDMLTRFFKNEQGNAIKTYRYSGKDSKAIAERVKWRFKRHAERPFWQWVCSWARACRRPSDLGYDDAAFVLPPLSEREHVVKPRDPREGWLFDMPAVGFREEREERRRTIQERCEMIAALVAHDEQALVWCQLNREGDALEGMIPDAEQVSGNDSDDDKESKLHAFADGNLRVLVTKPKIGAWGLNLQRCAHVTFFPSHSYEQYYQGTRRCWRFGQERPVQVDIVATEGERGVMANLTRKAKAADAMFSALVQEMNSALHVARSNDFKLTEEVPAWLSTSSQ
jgi:hypothetical protein